MKVSVEEWERQLGAQVRRARLYENLTQAEVATTANISTVTLSKLESGHGGTLSTFIRVLRALDRDEWLGTLEPAQTVSPLALAREAAGIREPQRASRRRR